MADAHTRQLCAEIVHTHFGPLSAKVASVLLTRGRLPFPQVVRFTGLKPRTVRASIIVLVQHNVMWHSKAENNVEIFEINVDECLMRLRFGRFIWLAEKLFGTMGSEIVQIILDHGKLQPPHILSFLRPSDNKKVSAYNQVLHKMVSTAYLKPSTILSHLSITEKAFQYEAEEKRKIVGYPTAKTLRESKEVAHARLKRDEEEAEKIGIKRKNKDPVGPRATKRKAVEVDEVDVSVYFKVNYERFNIHIRNAIFENAAKERFNQGAALVLKAALKVTENTQLRLSEPRSSLASVSTISMEIPEDVQLSSGLAYPSKKVPNFTCVKDYLGMLSSADNPTPEGRAAAFISYSNSKVQVEFETIARRLRRSVVEATARERHGLEGVRMLRLLLDTGKLDDKQIAKVVMMAPKDVRPLLFALSADSLISMQEVPKSADRNPTRTFYLWYVDLPKAFSMIVGGLYKTLHNISMRRRAEREVPEVAAVIEKSERTDVSQDENLLTRLEREMIKEWEGKQEKLAILESRVEETVFLIRDLPVSEE